FVQKLPKFSQRLVQLDLLRNRDSRIRHHPIRHEMPLEKSLRKSERLRAGEQQFLGLLHFLLALGIDFIHSISPLEKKRRRIVAMLARVSNHVQSSRLQAKASAVVNWILHLSSLLCSAAPLTRPAFGANAAGAGADDFVAAADRAGNAHEDIAERYCYA